MRFLLTGGEGFIGRNLKESLTLDGHDTITIDINGKPDYRASILELDAINSAVNGVDGVFHMAAATLPQNFEADLFSAFHTNVTGTLNVLKAAAEHKVRRVVLASSSAVYGDLNLPGREDMPIRGHPSMYATTKLFDEYLGSYFTLRKEVEVISLRLFNTYGVGDNSKGMYSSVISKFLESISRSERPVIYGDGSQRRDFIYVKDTVAGTKAAMVGGNPGEIYNIGSGRSYSFNEIIDTISRILDKEISPKYAELPFKTYQLFTQADMKKTTSELSWGPRFDLKSGVTEMCELSGFL
jgi:UDP-glucose 4-epimerase